MKNYKLSKLALPFLISFPFLLGGCETMHALFDESGSRNNSSDHRPVDIYENDRHAVAAENAQADRTYSITNQQAQTRRRARSYGTGSSNTSTHSDSGTRSNTSSTVDSEENVPVTPPSVPGVAPTLAE